MYHESNQDKIVVKDTNAPPIWPRFTELGTHKPLFCNRDGKPVYSLDKVDRERRTGYGWYVYLPQEVLDMYPEWQKKWVPVKKSLSVLIYLLIFALHPVYSKELKINVETLRCSVFLYLHSFDVLLLITSI